MSTEIESSSTGIYNRDYYCSCPDQCQKTWLYYNIDRRAFVADNTIEVKCSKYSNLNNDVLIQFIEETLKESNYED